MYELVHQLRRAVGVHAIQKACAAGGFLLDNRLSTAGADAWERRRTAAREVLSKLGYDLICLVELNLIADPQLEALNDVEVVKISTVHRGAVNDHIPKLAGDGYHAGAGGSKLKAEKLGFIQLVSPLERHDAVLVMACCSQTFAVGDIVVFNDKAIHGIGAFIRLEPVNDRTDLRLGGQIAQGKMMHHIKSKVGQELQLLMLHGEAVARDQVESYELQHTALDLGGVQLTDAPCGQAAGMGIRFLQLAVKLLEISPADHALATNLQRPCIRNGQRYVEHDPDRVRHILADTTLRASGDGLLQLAVLVTKHQRETVQLPRH